MKRILTFIACMLVAGVAYAGWNISQNADGGASWVNGDGVRVGVGGGTVIQIPIPNLQSGATQYYTVARPGTITRAYITATTTLITSSTPVVTLSILSQVTVGALIVVVPVTGTEVVPGQTQGVLSIVTGTVGHVDFNTFNSGNTAARGDIIAVVPTTVASGGGTGSAVAANGPDAYVTIVIE
ncbi:hypothetical protein LCGC14_2100290 [marine sediment metagenome]|uniref:Uncharacterized protein n=1 Tax=marine sediment metagenome TaxID=412755 RepID=A0A0F9EXD6_9ZZZZ